MSFSRAVFSSVILSCCFLATACLRAQQNKAEIPRTHGTVNILLSNGSDLVALVDSRLTNENTGYHNDGAQKVYKLDERLICTMAGYFSDPGAQGTNALDVEMPQIISDVRQSVLKRSRPGESFALRVLHYYDGIRNRLNVHLAAEDSSANQYTFQNNDLVELTFAGYDRNGSLKIADIAMAVVKTASGPSFELVKKPHASSFTPTCELTAFPREEKDVWSLPIDPGISFREVPKNAFFCDIAGITDTAERNLVAPYRSRDSVLREFAKRISPGAPLDVNGLVRLASRLETLTAEDHSEVGGRTDFATLSNGHVSRDPIPLTPRPGHHDMARTPFGDIVLECSGSGHSAIRSSQKYQPFQGTIKGCTQKIDGFIFDRSTFIDSELVFGGEFPVLFSSSNTVSHSGLTLEPQVNVNDVRVQKLLCSFPWDYIRQNKHDMKISCPTRLNVP